MRNDQNKHGPDIDIGVWYAALLRHSTDASGDSDAGRDVRAGPDGVAKLIPLRKHGEIDARGDPRESVPAATSCNALERAMAEKRRQRQWRSTIVNRCTGESPPGYIKELKMNNIDSAARSRLPERGHLLHGVIKADFGLMGGLCTEVKYVFVEKYNERRGTRDEIRDEGRSGMEGRRARDEGRSGAGLNIRGR